MYYFCFFAAPALNREDIALQSIRSSEINYAKTKIAWIEKPTDTDIGWGLPRFVSATSYDGLPRILKHAEIREKDFGDVKARVLFNTVLDAIMGILSSFYLCIYI